jgi:hypothetical protein
MQIPDMIDAAHEKRASTELPRPHMGCSLLGHPCDRYLWLNFRWAVIERFPGRILRLFRRGQNEESTVVADLIAAGLDVRHTGKQQIRVDLGGHVSGSIDGIIHSGVPEAPKKKCVLEIKTHSKKSFDELTQKGVEKSKFQHFVQMQLYMHGTETDCALYVAVCKDDDRIHAERIEYNKEVAEKYIERGHRLTLLDRMPEPISADPSWYQCGFCSCRSFCHETRLTKQVNCRTCAHSTALPCGAWHCALHQDNVPTEFQHTGCDGHVLHPELVPWKRIESPSAVEAVYEVNGVPVRNGAADAFVFSSKELIADANACALIVGDPFAEEIRETFQARVVAGI